MKFVWRYIWRKITEVGSEPEERVPSVMSSNRVGRDGDSEEPWGDGLRINVKRIQGGTVVTFYRYDHRTDRSDNRHYIIHEDADFNTELGKLITMESMRG
jgi:hypothetical protein